MGRPGICPPPRPATVSCAVWLPVRRVWVGRHDHLPLLLVRLFDAVWADLASAHLRGQPPSVVLFGFPVRRVWVGRDAHLQALLGPTRRAHSASSTVRSGLRRGSSLAAIATRPHCTLALAPLQPLIWFLSIHPLISIFGLTVCGCSKKANG